ncbi:MAG: NUDIX hydrolase [Opitutales bacterium]|nr:NUDIX hydrolase [Opitutales bacterium]
MQDPVKVWRKLDSVQVADCRVFKVFKNRFRHPDGREGDFFEIRAEDWVQAAALLDGEKVVMVRQFRFGIQKPSWEFSGGIIEKGETPEKAAERELLEETGYSGEAEIFASFSPNPAMQSNRAYFAVVKNCKKTAETNWDANEEIETKIFDVAELDKMVLSGEICHSIAINGVYFLRKYLEREHAACKR